MIASIKYGYKLPKTLKIYQKSDFAIQQKAKFIFYMIAAALIALAFIIITSVYLQIIRAEGNGIYLPVILLEIALAPLFIVCLILLVKGFFGLSAHLLMASVIVCVWLVMWIDKGHYLARLDTIIIIVALLNLAPLFITKYKTTILLYIIANIVALLFFMWFWADKMNLPLSSTIDYIIDSSISILFTGIVGYNIFNINKKTLDRALLEIKERKQYEETLIESEEKYRYLMENMNEVVMMVDKDDKVLFVNKRFTEKLGYTPDEIIGEIGYNKLVDPADREIIIEENKKRVQKITNQYELGFRHKDGTKIDFLISGAPIIDSEGITLGSIGTMTDITERKKAEKALMESEELNRKLIEAFPDIIMQSDLYGNILYGNEPFEKITGILPNDYNNPNRKAHIYCEDKGIIDDTVKDLLNSDKTHTGVIENRFIDSWGNIHWFSGRISKLYINGKIVLQTVTRDITEKKEIEQALEKYKDHLEILVKDRTEELVTTNEELKTVNEELYEQREELRASPNILNETQKQLIHSEKMASLGILSAGIAHEINNPLNFIHGGIGAIENHFIENSYQHFEKIELFIDAINVGVKRATTIVESLNHYSRQDTLPRVGCNLHGIIDNCLVMLHSQIKHKVEVNKKLTGKIPLVYGNEGKLHQAILNLLSNAVHAIENKGTIDINTEFAKNLIIITIFDTGCGISKENLDKVFDPFYTTKDPGKGTGLGLAITYNIIKEHNGSIEIESNLGKGTKVTVSFKT